MNRPADPAEAEPTDPTDARGHGGDALTKAIEALPVPLAFLDGHGSVIYQNKAAAAWLAAQPAFPWGDLLAASDRSSKTVPLRWGNQTMRLVQLVQPAEGHPGLYVATPLEARWAGPDPLEAFRLTFAERDVLDELIGGRSPAEIALRQDVSVATVRTHIARLHDKFGVGRTIDVVRLALLMTSDAS